MTTFFRADKALGDLLEVLREAVVQGTVMPYAEATIILLELDSQDAPYLTLCPSEAGTLVVAIHEKNGTVVDRWADWELGTEKVRDLWTTCRARTAADRTEEVIGEFTAWLRSL